MDKHLYFGLVGQEDIVPEVLLVHMQLCRPNQYFHILFREKRQTRGYSLAALSNKSHLFSLFFYFILLLTEARSLRCNIWIFFFCPLL